MYLKKMIASLGTAILLCLNFSTVSYADTVTAVSLPNDSILPAYEIADSCRTDLTIQNGTAHCTSIAEGTGAVTITVTQTLQKHWGLWIWEDVDGATWTRTADISSVCLYSTKSNLKNVTYRVKSVFTLTNKNSKQETITIYSSEKKIV